MFNLFDLFRKSKDTTRTAPDQDVFQHKYRCFERILAGNNGALEIIADLEHLFYEQERPLSLGYVLVQSEILIGEVFNIGEDLDSLSGGKYSGFYAATERIATTILNELERRRRIGPANLVIPIERLSRDNIAEVGGKAANLGEISNRVSLPVPQGFAVSAYACQQFMEYNKLSDLVEGKLRDLDVEDTERVTQVSEAIRSAILAADLPPELERSIVQAVADLRRRFGPGIRLAVRSSATSEDTEASFAGQHSTVLNVKEEDVLAAYKEVVASTFNPRAVFYRRRKGYLDQDVVMGAACVIMVEAKVSGVMYTVDPNDTRRPVIMISAVWGLGVGLVDGSSPADFYQVRKKDKGIEVCEVARKEEFYSCEANGGLKQRAVAEGLKEQPCLDHQQIQELADCGLRLEAHYGMPLDIEWALDHRNRFVFLQARPLKRPPRPGETASSEPARSVDHPVLLRGGVSASDGVAAGRAYILTSDHNLAAVPEGVVLIARQTSPRYVMVLGRVRAVVTDVGSVTGHMASVAREFQIPTLVGTGSATSVIPPGEEITVDARNRIIYKGYVRDLVKDRKSVNPMKGSPTYRAIQSALKYIAPLNVIDPKRESRPEAYQTIHDLIRFAHEMAMEEMFRISDNFDVEKSIALHLRTSLPLAVWVIDLGGGLTVDPAAVDADEENMTSVPFNALLRGMHHQGVQWSGTVGIDWRGFASILVESMFRNPEIEDSMSGASYAIVSGEYVNLSLRLGYHFATIDAYCGPEVNDNYIAFHFKGGAADIARRSRRAVLIGHVLKRLGFTVERKGDMVRASLKKYDCHLLEEKLDILGRLMGSVRLLDMVLSDDGKIDWYVDEFFRGNYTFQTNEG